MEDHSFIYRKLHKQIIRLIQCTYIFVETVHLYIYIYIYRRTKGSYFSLAAVKNKFPSYGKQSAAMAENLRARIFIKDTV